MGKKFVRMVENIYEVVALLDEFFKFFQPEKIAHMGRLFVNVVSEAKRTVTLG